MSERAALNPLVAARIVSRHIPTGTEQVKIAITAAALIFLSHAVHAEEKVWYCQEVMKSGLRWEDGKYKHANFTTNRYTVKQEGNSIIFPKERDFTQFMTECVQPLAYGRPEILSCGDKTTRFTLNTKTGKATYSRSFGWVGPQNGDVDDMFVTALTCETF